MYLDITNGNVYAWRAGDSLQGFVRIRSRLTMLSFFYGVGTGWGFFGEGFLYYNLGVIIFYFLLPFGLAGWLERFYIEMKKISLKMYWLNL